MNSAAVLDMGTRAYADKDTKPLVQVRRPLLGVSPIVALSLALPSALLLYLCFFPVAWGWLAWGALALLLLLTRCRLRPVTLYTITMLAGLVFYVPVLQWMRVGDDAMYFAWAFLATYCALYFPLALYFIRYLDRRTPLPLALTAPIVWTALEYLRSELGTGFSWYMIGHTQHDCLGVIQIADITGAYGVTFIVVMVNALLAETLLLFAGLRRFLSPMETPARYSRIGVLMQAGVVVVLLLGVRGYGEYRLGQNDFAYGPRLALLQGNLDQRVRNDPKMFAAAGWHFIDLCDVVAGDRGQVLRGAGGGGAASVSGRHAAPAADLVVWPETSYPWVWEEDGDGTPQAGSAKEAAATARRWRTPILVGLKSALSGGDGSVAEYNSALLLVDGEARGRYDKMHLVPLGEYVPFRHSLPIMKILSPYDFEYSIESGRQFTRFPLESRVESGESGVGVPDAPHSPLATRHSRGSDYTFGVLICYEDTDPDVARPYSGGDDRPPVDFLLNTSNDGWFKGTSEHEQHLAISRFRAIEGRRSIARAVNMGISAVIDPNGRVLPPQDMGMVMSERHHDVDPFPIHIWRVVENSSWKHDLPVSEWGKYKKVAGVLLAAMPIDTRTSFYARAGDWLPWTCWSALAVGMFAGAVRRLRSTNNTNNTNKDKE